MSKSQLSETALHFINWALQLVEEHLGTMHCFPVASFSWKNGTIKSAMHEVLCTSKALQNNGVCLLADWAQMAPVVHSALSAAYREQYHACLLKVAFERGSETPVMLEGGKDEGKVERLNPKRVQIKLGLRRTFIRRPV